MELRFIGILLIMSFMSSLCVSKNDDMEELCLDLIPWYLRSLFSTYLCKAIDEGKLSHIKNNLV